MAKSVAAGPHAKIAVDSARDRFALRMFDRLWDRYRARVPYVGRYEQLIAEAGATFVNDHVAFRTIAWQQPATGIFSVGRIFRALGYLTAGAYEFPTTHLTALHFQHPHPEFPKVFISELKAWELSESSRKILDRALASHRSPLDDEVLAQLHRESIDDATLLDTIVDQFQSRPWEPPEKEDVVSLARESQYGAWVLVHGYEVNHFTAFINSHGVPALDDIEKTVAALREAGVPMKSEIEGAPGSKLRQTATEAATIEVEVRDNGRAATMPWAYAYFELAERGEIVDPETGQRSRFEGFLGPQAAQLFEMTRPTR
jgi:hypothetical protein